MIAVAVSAISSARNQRHEHKDLRRASVLSVKEHMTRKIFLATRYIIRCMLFSKTRFERFPFDVFWNAADAGPKREFVFY